MTVKSPQTLDDDYRRSGFGRSLGFGTKQALLMVDFAQAYFKPGSPLFANTEITRVTAVDALEAARRTHLPVIHTRVEYDADGTNGGVFYRKIAALEVFRAGSALGDFADGLAPVKSEQVITKQYASGFFGTPLDRKSTRLNSSHIQKSRMPSSA